MKKKFLISVLVSFTSISFSYYHKDIDQAYKDCVSWMYRDFDVAMKTEQYTKAIQNTQLILHLNGQELLNLFRLHYDMLNPSKLKPDLQPTIPKIIHQVWLGGEVPQVFHKYMQTWIDKHAGRGWRYKFWTDEDVAKFKLDNQEFYEMTKNPGVQSDLLKWEIIYRYGGVYVDVDFECLKPLDLFHYTYDFYTCLQPLDTQFVQLGAALFAAKPYHPILKMCIETIKDDWHHKGAPTKSGPVHFTKSLLKVFGKTRMRDIVLPASYFYPQGCLETELHYETWMQEGAYAIHHWAKSWMPANYRKDEFKQLNNDDSAKSWND